MSSPAANRSHSAVQSAAGETNVEAATGECIPAISASPVTKTKVFGIGLSRTGTLSLTFALRTLGYNAVHTPLSQDIIREADALTDSPISFRFEQLDSEFPGAKFIQTMRDMESWLDSCRSRFSKPAPNRFFLCIRRALYGTDMFDEQAFRDAYFRFNDRVDRYFRRSPESLLRLNILENPDPWQPLCAFLGRPHPNISFPHKNKRPARRCRC